MSSVAVEPSVPNHARLDNWESHWSEYADSASINPAQDYRRKLILRELSKDNSGSTNSGYLVDIGSGQGDMLRSLTHAMPHTKLLGLELSASGIAAAKTKVPEAVFVQRDLLVSAPIVEQFAKVGAWAVCSEVLEHVDDPVALLRHASDYLADGALLVVTVPGGPRSAFDRHIGHRQHFNKKRLTQVLEEAGCSAIEVRAVGFPVFNLYKVMTIVAGKRLITSAAEPQTATTGLVSKLFGLLFKLPMHRSKFGWQLLATARVQSSTVGS